MDHKSICAVFVSVFTDRASREFFDVFLPVEELDLVVPPVHGRLPVAVPRQVTELVQVLSHLEPGELSAGVAVVAHLAPLRPRLRRGRQLIVPGLERFRVPYLRRLRDPASWLPLVAGRVHAT